MATMRFTQRFQESTKGRLLALLRRGARSIEDLAGLLRMTDNGVRVHIASLERDGIVRQAGTRATGGKPATLYEVAPEADKLFTHAYVPVLTQLVAVLEERLSTKELTAVLDEVGKRLAASVPKGGARLRSRVDTAAAVLTELGGIVDVEKRDGCYALRGYSCPLADAVRAHPATCRAAERLVADIVGERVHEECDKGERPRCHFIIDAA